MTYRISTTMRPDQVVEVGDTEYLDLKRQGLIARDHTRPTAAPTPPPAPADRTSKKAASPAATKED